MNRRRRTRNRRNNKGTSRWLIGVQLLVLTAVLVFLIGFRDYVSKTASSVVTGLGTDDLQVQKKGEGGAPGGSPDSPDAGSSTSPATPDASDRKRGSDRP